jgi:hypothetical protein
MAIDHNQIAILTRKKLYLMHLELSEDGELGYSMAWSMVAGNFGYATLTFVDAPNNLEKNPSSSSKMVRVVTSSLHRMHIYEISSDPTPDLEEDLLIYYVASYYRIGGPDEYVCRPLLGRAGDTVSWIEGSVPPLSTLTPMRFMTFTQPMVLAPPRRQCFPFDLLPIPPCFNLSENKMPALYAIVARDYDEQLGLLAIRNMMGELVLHSLSGSNLDNIQDCIWPLNLPQNDGKELLPMVSSLPIVLAVSLTNSSNIYVMAMVRFL